MAVYYRTRKQKDYNALMEELELMDKEVIWPTGHKPMVRNRWRVFGEDTIIVLEERGSGKIVINIATIDDQLFGLRLMDKNGEIETIEYRANKKKLEL